MADLHKANREEQSRSLLEFSAGQGKKSDELKEELKTLTIRTVEQLE